MVLDLDVEILTAYRMGAASMPDTERFTIEDGKVLDRGSNSFLSQEALRAAANDLQEKLIVVDGMMLNLQDVENLSTVPGLTYEENCDLNKKLNVQIARWREVTKE
jgi:hypothetical protein